MTRYAMTWGALAGAIAIGLICATLTLDLGHSVLAGYLFMLAALSLMFVAIKRYRDMECGGVIRFWPAFRLGLGIALVAGIVYMIGWELFVAATGYDFMADYSASMIGELRAAGASQAAIDAKAAEMRALAEQFGKPVFRMPMIFVEIFPVGVVVALASAALLRDPRVLPARA